MKNKYKIRKIILIIFALSITFYLYGGEASEKIKSKPSKPDKTSIKKAEDTSEKKLPPKDETLNNNKNTHNLNYDNTTLNNLFLMLDKAPLSAESNDYQIKYFEDMKTKKTIPKDKLNSHEEYIKEIVNKKDGIVHIVFYYKGVANTSYIFDLKGIIGEYFVYYEDNYKYSSVSYYDSKNKKRQIFFFDSKLHIIQINYLKDLSSENKNLLEELEKIEVYKENKLNKSYSGKYDFPIIPKIENVTFIGGDGSSIDKAIIINSKNEDEGVSMEYKYVGCIYGKRNVDWKCSKQALLHENKKAYDELEIILADKTKIYFYFDITSFFGKFD